MWRSNGEIASDKAALAAERHINFNATLGIQLDTRDLKEAKALLDELPS
jgi:hypothetical protein